MRWMIVCLRKMINRMSETANLVSIIMAAYNAEKTLDVAVKSVLSQTYENWELLIIDDCSKDTTLSIAQSYTDPRIRVLRNMKNSGVSITRKKGMEEAYGEWIAVLDSDDKWTPEKLEKQITHATNTGAELVFTGSAFMDGEGRDMEWQLHVPEKLTYRKLLKQNLVSNSSVLVKSNLYRKYYAIGDNMHEDFAIWLEITKSGKVAYGIDEPLLVYRVSNTSKSSNKLKAARMNWNTYRYVGLNPIQASYYMCWYTAKGLLKYRHLK